MKDKIHLNIRQKGVEPITTLQLEMLRRLFERADETSVLEGHVKVDFTLQDTVDFFAKYPDFTIEATTTTTTDAGGIIPEQNGSDPTVGRWMNEAIADVILENSYSLVLDEAHKKYALLSRDNDLTFDDGTTYSGTWGNAFKFIPRVYYHGENVNGKWQYLFSLAPVFEENNFFEEACIGKYLGAYDNGKLVSRPNLSPQVYQTMTSFWNEAQVNGADYGLYNYFQHQKMNALFMSKYGTRSSKTVIGTGFASSQNSGYFNIKSGVTANLGDGSGQTAHDAHSQVKLFGIEALWGQLWQFCPNIRFYNNGATAGVYKGNIVSNTADPVRTFNKLNNANGNYISKMALGEHFNLIPTEVAASVNTCWTDGTWASGGGELLLVGGASANGSLCGLSCASSADGFSHSSAGIGARLAFYGRLSEYELVTGAQLARLNW